MSDAADDGAQVRQGNLSQQAQERMDRVFGSGAPKAATDLPTEYQVEVRGYLQPNLSDTLALLSPANNITPENIKGAMYTNAFMKYNIDGNVPGKNYSSQDRIGNVCGRVLGRYQSAQNESTWDKGSGMPQERPWYHYTFFPVIRTIPTRGTVLRRVVTYVVLYSSFDPWETTTPVQGENGIEMRETMAEREKIGTRLPLAPPTWVEYQTPADRFNGNVSEVIKVDTNFLNLSNNEVNALLSIASSLNNCHPRSTAPGGLPPHLCFFPLVDQGTFTSEGVMAGNASDWRSLVSGWKLSGASMGMAVAAVISGFTSCHYTGYLKHIEHNQMLSDRVYGEAPNTLARNANGTYPTLAQFNIVENVDYIPLKVAYCLHHKLPLVIPAKDYLDRPMAPNKIKGQVQQFVGIAPALLTMAAVNDAAPILSETSSAYNGLATPIAMGVTLSDFMILGCYLYINLVFKRVKWYDGINSNSAVARADEDIGDNYLAALNVAHARAQVRKQENKRIADIAMSAPSGQVAYERVLQMRQAELQNKENALAEKRQERAAKMAKQAATRKTLTDASLKVSAIKTALKNKDVSDATKSQFRQDYSQYEDLRAQIRPDKNPKDSYFRKYADSIPGVKIADKVKKTRAKKTVNPGTTLARRGVARAGRTPQPAQPMQQQSGNADQQEEVPRSKPANASAGQFGRNSAGAQFGRNLSAGQYGGQAAGQFGHYNTAGGQFGADNEAGGQFGMQRNDAGFFGDLAKGVASVAPVVGGIASLFSGL